MSFAVFLSAQKIAKVVVCCLGLLSWFPPVPSMFVFEKPRFYVMFRTLSSSSVKNATAVSETEHHHNSWSSTRHDCVNRCFYFLSAKDFFELHRLWSKCAQEMPWRKDIFWATVWDLPWKQLVHNFLFLKIWMLRK